MLVHQRVYMFIPSNHTHFLLKSRIALFTSNITPAKQTLLKHHLNINKPHLVAPGDYGKADQEIRIFRRTQWGGTSPRHCMKMLICGTTPGSPVSKNLWFKHQVAERFRWKPRHVWHVQSITKLCDLCCSWVLTTILAEFSVSASFLSMRSTLGRSPKNRISSQKCDPSKFRIARLEDLQHHFRNPYGRGGKASE